jgi:hypothetical protein
MNLKEDTQIILKENQHAHSVEHGKKEYQCEECYNQIPIGAYSINYTEEVAGQYGKTFERKRFCSKVCFMNFLRKVT